MENTELEQSADKKKLVIGFLLVTAIIMLLIAGSLIKKAIEKSKEPDEAIIEYSFQWEFDKATMNIGDERTIFYTTNKEDKPDITIKGNSIVIISYVENGINIKATTSGTTDLIVTLPEQEQICTIMVNQEVIYFNYDSGLIWVNEIQRYELTVMPMELLEKSNVFYYIENQDIAEIIDYDHLWIELRGKSAGETKVIAEWRGKRAEMAIEVALEKAKRMSLSSYKEYIFVDQETDITAFLEDMSREEVGMFKFNLEKGKQNIEISKIQGNIVTIKGKKIGEQNLRVSHGRAKEAKVVTFDVIPSGPPPSPRIDISESPVILQNDQVKNIKMIVTHGKDSDSNHFNYQIIENDYAITVQKKGDMLIIKGIKPGAAKIRITNTAINDEYDLMVIVDDGLGH